MSHWLVDVWTPQRHNQSEEEQKKNICCLHTSEIARKRVKFHLRGHTATYSMKIHIYHLYFKLKIPSPLFPGKQWSNLYWWPHNEYKTSENHHRFLNKSAHLSFSSAMEIPVIYIWFLPFDLLFQTESFTSTWWNQDAAKMLWPCLCRTDSQSVS